MARDFGFKDRVLLFEISTVIGILCDIDAEMRNDPAYRWDMLEPIEVMGVQEFADSGVIIRARLKTRAGQQFPPWP